MSTIKTFLVTSAIAALVGSAAALSTVILLNNFKEKTNNELIKDFYAVENAGHISPHGLRGKLDKGGTTVLLVDLRSAEEYEKEHIIGAINIPAYSDPRTPAYEDVDRIVAQFKAAIAANPGREVITYCYSSACMTGRKIGKILTEHDVYVKTLIIGWNEWRHFWTLWNHEHEWEATKPEDYIWKGKEPGVPVQRELPTPCGKGEFSC